MLNIVFHIKKDLNLKINKFYESMIYFKIYIQSFPYFIIIIFLIIKFQLLNFIFIDIQKNNLTPFLF